MARILKEAEYNAKRNEILDFTMSLVHTKGYSQLTIQDVLDGLHISRGAFYHYFDSKETLFEAVIDRLGMKANEFFLPILHDPDLTAVQKFRRYFEAAARWKNSEKALVVDTLRTWYTEENMILRQKLAAKSITITSGVIEPMIRQGIAEKSFTTPYPAQSAEIIAGIALNLSDSLVEPLISSQPDPSTLQKIEIILDAYFDTIERILGAPPGSLKALSAEDFRDWFVVSQPVGAHGELRTPLGGMRPSGVSPPRETF